MTYSPTCVDKNLDRGNSVRYRLTVREPQTGAVPDPPAIDLTGSLVVFEVKKQPEPRRLEPTDDVVIRKTSDNVNEIEILDQTTATGQCLIRLIPADTEFLAPGTYAYSIDVTTAFGDRRTVTKGRIFLRGPATAAENWTPVE